VIDGAERSFVYQEGINNHSVTIIPLLQEMLDKDGIKLSELDEVVIGIGPGSYTGVRIGVTVAKMIGYLNNIKVRKVSSLALIASASQSKYVMPFIDARRGNAFIALLEQSDSTLKYLETDILDNIDDFKSKYSFEYDFISDGKPNVLKILASNLLEVVEDINDLQPNYLRITEAERNKR
jgi:tRNA threonylcarbamoyladenosine biosynthesis protein TsaB